MWRVTASLCTSLMILGSGCDSSTTSLSGMATPSTTTTRTATHSPTPTATPDLSGLATPVPGTSVAFDLDADLSDPGRFYDLPYPSDLRLDEQGRPEVDGFPFPADNVVIAPLARIAGDRPGFPTIPVAYFRFSASLAEQDLATIIAADSSAPILLIDVDPASPERGRLFPTVATAPGADAYVPEFLLTVAAPPGIILHPGRTYAFVVTRSLGDASGNLLGVPESFAVLRSGGLPQGENGPAARDLYGPLWGALDGLGISRADVAAATVFTTGDVVAEMARIAADLSPAYTLKIEDLRLDPDDGGDHERFCELIGHVSMPQFQRGVPPFGTEGIFEFDADGLPIEQREEIVPITLTLPRRPMPPDGYPLVIYFHGSNGFSGQVVDRGPVSDPGGERRKGAGPAHVLAGHGFAALGSSHPLSPERLPGAGDRAYINLINLAAYRDTFRQGTIEQHLLLDAVGRLEIAAQTLEACAGPSLPEGASEFRIRPDPVYAMGQSMGAQYLNMVGATDARIEAVMPSGSGGLWSLLLLVVELAPGVDPATVIGSLIGTDERLTYLHPALTFLELAWEPAEPIVYAPRLAKRPLAGHPVRPIYQPVGQDDPDFPIPIFNAMALAHGNQQAGDLLWPSMQDSLALESLDGLAPYPVHQNLTSETGVAYTGAVVQYEGDGIVSPHHIFAQLDEVKHQYGCFFETIERTGVAVVPEPAALGSECAEE